MRWVLTGGLLAVLLCAPLALTAQDEGNLKEKLRIVEDLMRKLQEAGGVESAPELSFEKGNKNVLRVYSVADLTVRLTDFIHPNLKLQPAGSEIDESQPLFGAKREGEIFFTGAEEISDLIRNNVRPEVWGGGLSSVRVSGAYGLIVIAEPDVQAEVREYLLQLRRGVLRVVTVEVRVLQVDFDQVAGLPRGGKSVLLPRGNGLALLARAERGDGMKVVHSARVTGFNGQKIALHHGAQRSIVQDYDVEVAQTASISDPIVGVLQTGLAFDVRPIVRGEGLVMLDIRAQISGLKEKLRVVETSSGPVHAPAQSLLTLETTVKVPAGGFALVAAGSDSSRGLFAILLSATTEKIESRKTGGGR